MPDLPDTCGQKPYPERYSCGLKNFPDTGGPGLKLVLKMGLKNWNTNIRLQTSDRGKWTIFPDVPLAPFQCNDPKSPVPFTFQLAFLETF